MRFLADAGVSRRVVAWLRSRGHDAIHLRDQGLEKLPDLQVFEKASAEARIVLTFDLDFGEIVALSGRPSANVIVFRLRDTSTPHVVERLDKVLTDSADELEQGPVVVVVEEGRHRVRRFPWEER